MSLPVRSVRPSVAAAVFVALATAGCAVVTGSISEAMEQPQLNTAARDVFRVTVLNNAGMPLRLTASYGTSDRSCDVEKWPGNPKIGHQKFVTYDVQPSSTEVTFDVPVDRFLPGRCSWRFAGLDVGSTDRDERNGLLGFSEAWSRHTDPAKPILVQCGQKILGDKTERTCQIFGAMAWVRSDVRQARIEARPRPDLGIGRRPQP